MFDCHVHSEKSSDSMLKVSEVEKKIREHNIGIILTEHIDLNYPDKELFKLDTKRYLSDYNQYRNDKLLLGVEIGLSRGFEEQYRRIIENNELDFILGAVHEYDGKDLHDVKELYLNPKKDLHEKYFEYVVECINKNPYINSFAHIDYICRYTTYDNPEINYNDSTEFIDEILRTLIDKDICFEINTRRLDNREAYNSLYTIYKRYHELGGKYVTFGSDAHSKGNIAMNFAQANEIADACGLIPVYFKNMKMQFL